MWPSCRKFPEEHWRQLGIESSQLEVLRSGISRISIFYLRMCTISQHFPSRTRNVTLVCLSFPSGFCVPSLSPTKSHLSVVVRTGSETTCASRFFRAHNSVRCFLVSMFISKNATFFSWHQRKCSTVAHSSTKVFGVLDAMWPSSCLLNCAHDRSWFHFATWNTLSLPACPRSTSNILCWSSWDEAFWCSISRRVSVLSPGCCVVLLVQNPTFWDASRSHRSAHRVGHFQPVSWTHIFCQVVLLPIIFRSRARQRDVSFSFTVTWTFLPSFFLLTPRVRFRFLARIGQQDN